MEKIDSTTILVAYSDKTEVPPRTPNFDMLMI